MVQQAKLKKAHSVLLGEVELRFTSVIKGPKNPVYLDWYFLDDAMEYIERNASLDVTGLPYIKQADCVENMPLDERMTVKRYVYNREQNSWQQTIKQGYN